ncbi:MAG TPA: hypothetical protein VKA58_12000, partial [Propionibacteriaceae bacterium]|nr:hypothetical protein [Propionibacteriaceae bacterium]
YETVIKLLPRLVWRGLDAADRMHILSAWSGVAHDAAACAISADQPERALEPLDQSRSMLWGQRRELRSDLSEFAARYPALRSSRWVGPSWRVAVSVQVSEVEAPQDR